MKFIKALGLDGKMLQPRRYIIEQNGQLIGTVSQISRKKWKADSGQINALGTSREEAAKNLIKKLPKDSGSQSEN